MLNAYFSHRVKLWYNMGVKSFDTQIGGMMRNLMVTGGAGFIGSNFVRYMLQKYPDYYIVVYDNNSYAGPVASFLGCSHYQFAIRSSRLGFAGPRVIRDTTGQEVPPDYHSARNALRRGHIQGIWDRRDFRRNLHKCLMTMGGSKLYYR